MAVFLSRLIELFVPFRGKERMRRASVRQRRFHSLTLYNVAEILLVRPDYIHFY